MSKPDLLKTAALLLAVSFGAQAAWAQSGRKGQKSPSPVPSESGPQGESESGPKPAASKKPDALASFVVMRGDEGILMIDPLARDGVAQVFLRRLGASEAVSVSNAGAGSRGEARTRAKGEATAYVVLFQLEEENYATTTGGRADSRALVIKTFVYAPKTGDLKFTDTIYQRPYRGTARVGGIPVPVPTRGIERYPSQRELEQAARDAADRLLGRFHITPADN
jgi:hypothetical protein